MTLKDIGTAIIKKLLSSSGNKRISLFNHNTISKKTYKNETKQQVEINNFYGYRIEQQPTRLSIEEIIALICLGCAIAFITWQIQISNIWNWETSLYTNMENCMPIFANTTALFFGITALLYIVNSMITFFHDKSFPLLGIFIFISSLSEMLAIYNHQLRFPQILLPITSIHAFLMLVNIGLMLVAIIWNICNIFQHRDRYTAISNGTGMTITYILYICLCFFEVHNFMTQ